MKKVMLAVSIDPKKVKFPVIASPKIDGVRCHIDRDATGKIVAFSRTNKPIPNRYVQSLFAIKDFLGLDGELTVGPSNAPDVFRQTTSGVMSVMGKPDVQFNVFDNHNSELRFEDRVRGLEINSEWWGEERLVVVYQKKLNNYADLLEFEQQCLKKGYEGIIVRSPDSPYKEGRSTVKEGWMLKIKRFIDAEATVIGFEELMTNQNEQERDERGYAKRSSSKEGLVPANTLGALVVEMDGIKFNIGSGFDAKTRKEIWEHKNEYLGKLAKFKHFDIGSKDAPRFPIFLGWRDEIDV